MNYSEKWIGVLNLNLKPKNSAWSTGAIGQNESALHRPAVRDLRRSGSAPG